MNNEIKVQEDKIVELLDEMADMCEYWKRNRDKGRTPSAIRLAMVMLADEISAIYKEASNGRI